MDTILAELMKMFPALNTMLGAGVMVFARLIGFVRLAPVFNRKEIPSLVKLSLCFLLTLVITPFVKTDLMIMDSFYLSIVLNIVVGALIGYMAQLILLAVEAGADMINMQMGLSSAMVLDP
ncbi:flagellar biosynthetic protein FliR, partial [bacterium]|nr:flagellar biosynthetic protein FliR [bacterium]